MIRVQILKAKKQNQLVKNSQVVSMSRKLTILIFLIGVSGCLGDHYGYTQEEWATLSSEQQEEAKEQYKKLVENKYKQVHGNKIQKATTELVNRGAEKSNNADN